MALRKKLSASLLQKADGKSVKTSSANMINDYIQTIEKLNIKNNKLGQSFWRELSFMVLDTRIPLIINKIWFDNLWIAHELFITETENSSILGLKSNSFYLRMENIFKYRHLNNLDKIRTQDWMLISIDLYYFKEARDEKIKFYQKNHKEIDKTMIGIFQKMTRRKFRLFLTIIEKENFIAQTKFTVLLSLIVAGENNFDGINKFVNLAIPVFLQKIERFCYRKHHHQVVNWYQFWNRNLPLRNTDELIEGIHYLPKFVVNTAGFNHQIMDFLSWGESIRKFDPDHWYFTKKMAHIFQNYQGKYSSFSKLYYHCLFKSISTDEQLTSILTNFQLGSTQEDIPRYMRIISKLETWKLYDLPKEKYQNILGYIIHGYQDIDKFSVKFGTLASISRKSDAYYEEVLEKRKVWARSMRMMQLSERKVQQLRKRERRKLLQIERRNKLVWSGLDYDDFEYNHGVFKIVQLRDFYALREEGRTLRHCVESENYAKHCMHFGVSIWSLKSAEGKSLLTIQTRHKRIVQIRGKLNRAATKFEMQIIQKWCDGNDLEFAKWFLNMMY